MSGRAAAWSRRGSVVVVAALMLGGLTACGGEEPSRGDVPADVLEARPDITVEEARFVLEARKRGVFVTGESVGADLEDATAVCWALQNGGSGVTLGTLAVDGSGAPLGNDGVELRTKQVMAAAVTALCPDYASQVPQLKLPG